MKLISNFSNMLGDHHKNIIAISKIFCSLWSHGITKSPCLFFPQNKEISSFWRFYRCLQHQLKKTSQIWSHWDWSSLVKAHLGEEARHNWQQFTVLLFDLWLPDVSNLKWLSQQLLLVTRNKLYNHSPIFTHFI